MSVVTSLVSLTKSTSFQDMRLLILLLPSFFLIAEAAVENEIFSAEMGHTVYMFFGSSYEPKEGEKCEITLPNMDGFIDGTNRVYHYPFPFSGYATEENNGQR